MILALVSALAYSAQSLLARKLGPTESALGMTFHSQIAFIVLSGLTGLAFGTGWLDQIDHAKRAISVPGLDPAHLVPGNGC